MFCLQFGSYATSEGEGSYKTVTMSTPKIHNTRGCTSPTTTKRQMLMNSLEEILNKEQLLNMADFERADNETKFNLLSQAVLNVNNKFANVHEIVNDAENGLNSRLEENETTITALLEENKQLCRELDISKGLIAKQEIEINGLRSKVTSLTARSMRQNIIIGGITEEQSENCKELENF